jgi:hypothetical protein
MNPMLLTGTRSEGWVPVSVSASLQLGVDLSIAYAKNDSVDMPRSRKCRTNNSASSGQVQPDRSQREWQWPGEEEIS